MLRRQPWMCAVLLGAVMALTGPSGVMADESGDKGPATVGAAVATLAGGCFWCVESDLEKVPGIREVVSGYSGGTRENAVYKKVSAGETRHYEAIQVYFDPDVVTYAEVLDAFWKHVDPTDSGGQFVDRGAQYRTAIFFHDDIQREIAERSKQELDASKRFSKPIVTPIVAFDSFYKAEEYHQDFYKKSPERYYRYRNGSGRDAFIQRVWGAETADHGKEE